MNTATFRTLCETMGIEQGWIAEILDVGVRSVRRWCSPRETYVPEFAADWISDWWDRYQVLVGAEVARIRGAGASATWTRFESDLEVEADGLVPTLSMHEALLGLVLADLAREDLDLDLAIEWNSAREDLDAED